MANEFVKVKALKVKEGKVQHMIIGEVYEVTPEQAENLIAKKVVEKVKDR